VPGHTFPSARTEREGLRRDRAAVRRQVRFDSGPGRFLCADVTASSARAVAPSGELRDSTRGRMRKASRQRWPREKGLLLCRRPAATGRAECRPARGVPRLQAGCVAGASGGSCSGPATSRPRAANDIVLLFPQNEPSYRPLNTMGCWDWWGYEGDNYAVKDGPQIKAVRMMIGDLLGEPRG